MLHAQVTKESVPSHASRTLRSFLHLVSSVSMRVVFCFSRNEVVVDDIRCECDNRRSESREHAPAHCQWELNKSRFGLNVPEHCSIGKDG